MPPGLAQYNVSMVFILADPAAADLSRVPLDSCDASKMSIRVSIKLESRKLSQ